MNDIFDFYFKSFTIQVFAIVSQIRIVKLQMIE